MSGATALISLIGGILLTLGILGLVVTAAWWRTWIAMTGAIILLVSGIVLVGVALGGW